MRGSVFKRCTVCGARVPARSCATTGCSSSSFTWAYIVDAGRKPDGARRQIKRMGFDSRAQAEEALSELLASMHAGTWVPPSRLTVGDYLLDRWLPRTRTGEKPRADRELHMRVYVVPRLGGLTLEELSGDDLTYLYDDLAVLGRRRAPHPQFGHGLSPTTVRRIHTMLHKAFADAIRWGLLERNPCDRADPPSTSEVKGLARSARHTYTWDELARFLDVASDDRLFAMWHLFVTTGMRRSEVAALLWRNVDLDAGLLSVTRAAVEVRGKVDECELTKSSSSRRAIELAEQDIAVLRQHRKAQLEEQIALHGSWRDVERVFTSPTGDRLHPPNITRAFHVLTNRAGLQRITLHDLRHTFATLMLKSGEPPRSSPNGSATRPRPTPRTRTRRSCRGCSETQPDGSVSVYGGPSPGATTATRQLARADGE